jgi:hypothetical protein
MNIDLSARLNKKHLERAAIISVDKPEQERMDAIARIWKHSPISSSSKAGGLKSPVPHKPQ